MTNYEKIKTMNKIEIAAMLATGMMAAQIGGYDPALFKLYLNKFISWLDEED